MADISKEFIHYLTEAVKAARNDGIDSIELVHEDKDVEIYFYKGSTGIGDLANEYKKSLWQLTHKDIPELKVKLNVKRISLKDYNHFGENARKLLIDLTST